MCGRYSLSKLEQVLRLFPSILDVPKNVPPRFNIAPTQPILAIANNEPDRLQFFHWGLIPSWAKDQSIGNKMINARAETLAEKPAFRTALKRRRCLIPADGFYEWRKDPHSKAKTPMHIRLREGEPFAFAGLWETWESPDGSVVPSCTIITTAPNELMSSIHDRMPVILSPADHEAWLHAADSADALRLLRPFPARAMEAFAVSKRVNAPANDDAHLIEPVEEEPAATSLFQ